MRKIIVALDSFKGSVSSVDANRVAAEGLMEAGTDTIVETIAVSDGGEGWIEAFHETVGGEFVEVETYDPLMRPINAKYLIIQDTAIIEIAQASGLLLLKEEERNPMRTTSYGTGLLLADAIKRGLRKFLIGLGGSATSDAGMGMLKAVVDTLAPHGSWDDILDLEPFQFTVACDVRNPLCGKQGAAHVYGPQKGATPEMVKTLDEKARKFAEVSARHFGYDCSKEPGSGAAGGLGYAFMQYFKARQQHGIDLLLDVVRFDDYLHDADVVITGEGSSDAQTLMGKVPMGILHRAQKYGLPTILIAGQVNDWQQLLNAGFAMVRCINPEGADLKEAMLRSVALQRIKTTAVKVVNDFDRA